MITAYDISHALGITLPAISKSTTFTGVSIDSRTTQPGNLFVALRGEFCDGHDFINQVEGIAAACLIEHPVSTSLPCFLTPDTGQALTQLATYWREHVTQSVIAITGSCGKTSTRAILDALLTDQVPFLSSQKSFNNMIGVPLTLLQADQSHEHLVFEVGTNFPGEIAAHTTLLKPKVAVILNASDAHLAGLGSVAGVVQEKGDLLLGLQNNGTAILNRDDPHCDTWVDRLTDTQTLLTFGTNEKADIQARNCRLNEKQHACFDLHTPQGDIAITLPLLGRHHIYNALAAISVALTVGIALSDIPALIAQAKPETRRLNLCNSSAGAQLIDDSYNANPASTRSAIRLLAEWKATQKYLVLGDMLELGEQSEQFHREMGSLAKELGIHQLHGYGKDAKYAVNAFGAKAKHWPDLASMADSLREELSTESVVLVKGSNGMKLNQLINLLQN